MKKEFTCLSFIRIAPFKNAPSHLGFCIFMGWFLYEQFSRKYSTIYLWLWILYLRV